MPIRIGVGEGPQVTHNPLYTHDCSKCIYMGSMSGIDVYICPNDILGPTVIGRRSGDPGDYGSGARFVTDPHFFYDGQIDPDAWTNVCAAVLATYAIQQIVTVYNTAKGKQA